MARAFTCSVCGANGVDNSATQNRRFCSRRCSNYYHQKKRYADTACKFNEGVTCNKQRCKNCGWNPAVAMKRSEAFL